MESMDAPAAGRPRRGLVAVIGDSNVAPGSRQEQLCLALGGKLVEAGYRVVTGGLGGVMEAACRGARSSPAYQPGDTVGLLPGFDPADANPYVDIALPTGMDHLRNGLVASADAVVAVGGGAGTMAELAHAWILKRLIIALRIEGWSGKLADTRLDERLRCPDVPEDRVFGADTAEEVIGLLQSLLPRYEPRHRGVRRRT